MRCFIGLLVLLAMALPALTPAAANAADPGRWKETGVNTIPLNYYQGIASDPAGNVYFDGIHVGLYRTDASLRETARNDDVIPPAVTLTERFNHIGDIAWDAREGGRVLLPLECYLPYSAPGQADPHNPCNVGAIGVADPATLQWRYYVRLDPAEIPKAMWVTVSPDGSLLWTISGNDLLAYRAEDVRPENAAPAGPPIKAVRRVVNARPPTGSTGAAFGPDGRLYMPSQDGETFRVWSLDLDAGASSMRLEIEKQVVGEAEGIDFFDGLGGSLHWVIAPYNQRNIPTYGVNNSALLHFVPVGASSVRGVPQKPSAIRLTVTPRKLRAGRRVTLRLRTTAVVAGRVEPAGGARVTGPGGSKAYTNEKGVGTLSLRVPKRAKTITLRAKRDGLRSVSVRLRIVRR
jgi:hypothetical protein